MFISWSVLSCGDQQATKTTMVANLIRTFLHSRRSFFLLFFLLYVCILIFNILCHLRLWPHSPTWPSLLPLAIVHFIQNDFYFHILTDTKKSIIWKFDLKASVYFPPYFLLYDVSPFAIWSGNIANPVDWLPPTVFSFSSKSKRNVSCHSRWRNIQLQLVQMVTSHRTTSQGYKSLPYTCVVVEVNFLTFSQMS